MPNPTLDNHSIPLLRNVKIMGSFHRGPEGRARAENLDHDSVLYLDAEPENVYDPFAVKVTIDGLHIGYVPKECSPAIAFLISQAQGTDRAVVGLATGEHDGTNATMWVAVV